MRTIDKIRQLSFPIGRLNHAMAVITILLSGLLLFTTTQTRIQYHQLRTTSTNYIRWQNNAYELQLASDYLTDQARAFVVTGEERYLNAYFTEAKVTCRREAALNNLKEMLGESMAYQELEDAMEHSVTLMDQEYYAMRLTAEANGYDIDRLPSEIQDIQLSALDRTLSPGAKEELARRMMYDDTYWARKAAISGDMQDCLDELVAETDSLQSGAMDNLDQLLLQQQTLIVLLITIILAIVLLTGVTVIRPLLRAVQQIENDRPLSTYGAHEFRFLAETYNMMYELNRESREKLAFEASHDKLTGVYNRSGYDLLMDNSNLASSALLLIDVDHFKAVNDTYGHEMGDRVLTNVANVLVSGFGSQDYVFRIGGDEFAVLMGNADVQRTEEIRSTILHINHLLLHPKGGLPPVSLSVGVAFGSDGIERQGLFKLADAALYRVKAAGRRGCDFAASH